MNMTECIKGRRSIRKYTAERIERSVLEDIISTASFSPSWKNTQITRYIAIEDTSIIQEIADKFTPEFNSNIIRQVSTLMAVTFIKNRCGFERDGSYSTKKEIVGKCSMSVLHARHSVLLPMNKDWGL